MAPVQPTPAAATGTAPAAPAAAPAAAATAAPEAPGDAPLIVAVTSCATGIAHTYMAADSLKQAAEAKGIKFIVETQGSAGMTPLNPADIKAADAVIFAHDVDVRDRSRFAGKPVIDVPVKKGIDEPEKLLDDALANAKSAHPKVVSGSADEVAAGAAETQGVGEKIRSWLMTGVSYMLPFVSAGGILIAIGFLLASIAWKENGVIAVTQVTDGMTADALMKWLGGGFAWGSLQSWAVLIFWVGKWSFSFLVPALSGYIAYGIADRPGIAPGFVGGFAAGLVGAGFLGGIVTGFLGGFLAKWISSWKVPAGVRGIMPVVVTPLLSVGITGIATALIIGPPMKWINDSLTNGLNSMQGGSAVILGVIVGLMMCFDLGGPVNKVAYVFATTGLANAVSATSGPAHVMAAVMAAGMVPPLAIGLATLIRPKLWTAQERDAGKSAWLLGASFVSEGAIPFAASDPLRMIPSFMVGGAITGGLSMAFGAGSLAPHGGIWVLPLIGNPLMFVLALIIGFVVSALMLTALKSMRARKLEHAA